MASSVYDGEDEYLIGSDSVDEIYKPLVLKTFKSGIDRLVTSIAFGKNVQFGGYFALVCYSNKQLAIFNRNCDFNIDVELRSLSQEYDRYLIRDISVYAGKQIMFSTYKVNGGSFLHWHIGHSDGNSSVVFDVSSEDTTGHIITGICLLKDSTNQIGHIFAIRPTYRLAICYVDALTYEITSKSRRYVVNVDAYSESDSELSFSVCSDTLIEFEDVNKKERYFTFPKRIARSDLGDKWIIDRKSPSNGDVKVFQSNKPPLLKFVYRGNPGSTFDPMDIKPSQGVMVISDCSNHNVHLVKNDGTFLMHVMTGGQGLQYPRALCVDAFDRIWIGCDDGTIHILKYRNEFEA